MPQEERAQIGAVELRLAQKHTELPHDHVAAVVQHVYAAFDQSKLRDYVPLLVERRAREVLARSPAALATVAEVPISAVAGSDTIAVLHQRPEWRSATRSWLSARFAFRT